MSEADLRLMRWAKKAALRWWIYAEAMSTDLGDLRSAAAREMPRGTSGPDIQTFLGQRSALREQLKAIDTVLYPADD